MEANPDAGLLIQKMQEEEERRKKKMMMKVMVAVDESAERFYAVNWALDILYCILGVSTEAADGGDGIITLVHVRQLFIPDGSPADYLSNGPRVTGTLILDGDPKDVICQAVEQMHIDVLLVGSRGLGKIKRALLGSVSDYRPHHAVRPILIV